jgi:hypothetical protein
VLVVFAVEGLVLGDEQLVIGAQLVSDDEHDFVGVDVIELINERRFGRRRHAGRRSDELLHRCESE